MRDRPRPLLSVLLVALLLVSGCGVAERALSRGLIEEWSRAKGLYPFEGGTLHLPALLALTRRVLFASTGEVETDAALGVSEIIADLREADRLMDMGRRTRDPRLMDKAIALRPHDWAYRLCRAVLAIEQDDLACAERELRTARILGMAREIDQRRYLNRAIAELEELRYRLGAGAWTSVGQCRYLFRQLAYHYQARAQLTDAAEDKELAERYRQMATLCKQLP